MIKTNKGFKFLKYLVLVFFDIIGPNISIFFKNIVNDC